MASSSMSTLRRRAEDGSEVNEGFYANVRCSCGELARESTSWTQRNPGRRFLGCPNFRNASGRCNYFRWIDPELEIQCYKRKFFHLHNALRTSESEGSATLELLMTTKQELKMIRRWLFLFIFISIILVGVVCVM